MRPASELRYDIVSKDWVVVATGRARRPEAFKSVSVSNDAAGAADCPFCRENLVIEEKPILVYCGKNDKRNFRRRQFSKSELAQEYEKCKKKWGLIVIPNKYPAFSEGVNLNKRKEGPFSIMDGVGFHEVVITADHYKSLGEMSVSEIKDVLDAYHERYLDLMNEPFVNYVAIFHNHGRGAGASIFHPHSQIIAIPIIDPDLRHSLEGSRRYFMENKKCVHCVMLNWDRKDGRRVIFENEKFVVLCSFAPRVSFEVRIYPKKHNAYFERIKNGDKELLSEAFSVALKKLYKGLNNPPYNFFIHTAPCDGKDYDHYHWHIEILPKTAIWAGFELGTGIEISTIEPEKAAGYLRGIK